jgi:uncharacterized protein YjiS (DUF1127 family)
MTDHALYRATSFDDDKGSTFFPRIARNWLARRAVAKLDRYDDHLLRDIGVNRADVRWAMRLPLTVDSTTALKERVYRME